MPSRSRPSSPYEKEKPYDQGSEQSSDEDFVNAATAPRPSSRTSAASGGSRSSRKPKVVSESSSESIDSEEERELQSELQDAAGTETGVVRGAPVESTGARIMRSVAKGSSGSRSSQRYASLANAEEGQSRRHGKHHKKRSSARSDYNLSQTTKAPKDTPLGLAPGEGRFSGHDHETLQGKPKKKRVWLWVLLGVIILIVVALIIAAAIFFVKRKSGDDADDVDSASNSTSLSDHANSTSTANSTLAGHKSANSTGLGHESATQTRLPDDVSSGATASPANTASYDDGKYHPSTGAAAVTSSSSTASNSLEDVDGELASATQGVESVQSSGQSVASPVQTGLSTPTQVYGQRPSSSAVAGSESIASSGSVVQGGVASIQTVPNPSPSPVTGDEAEYEPSSAGQWNALSNSQGAAQAQPTQAQAGQSTASSDLHFGPGPVVPSETQAGQQGVTPTSVAVIGGGGGEGTWNNGQPATASSAPTSWDVSQQAQDRPASPVDSIAPGPFTTGEFRQATHPEQFQTFNSPATWFESSGHYGACGIATTNNDFIVAISDALWLNSTQGSATAQSSHCGAEVLVTSMATGATVNAWVTERCALCSAENDGSIDLSKAAFKALSGSTDAGSLQVVWGFTGNHSTATSSSMSTVSGNGTAVSKSLGDSEGGNEIATATSDDSWFWRRQTMI